MRLSSVLCIQYRPIYTPPQDYYALNRGMDYGYKKSLDRSNFKGTLGMEISFIPVTPPHDIYIRNLNMHLYTPIL